MLKVFKEIEEEVRLLEKSLDKYDISEKEKNDIIHYLAVIKLAVLPRLNHAREGK